jgi:nitroreductase
MKKHAFLITALFACAVLSGAQEADLGPILNHYAARDFAAGAVSRNDLDLIIRTGVRAPSAGNRQPWHFTVVQNDALARRIVPNTVDGNVLIVISAPDGGANGRVILDCALAAQSIYLAAQALGYGSRIYTGPIDALNRDLKTDLGIPAGDSAVVLVRIGRIRPGVDAVSAASARKTQDSMVTYK